MTITMQIDREDDEDWYTLEVEVCGTVTRGRPETLLDPPEPSEVEIQSVMCDGNEVALSSDEEAVAMRLLDRRAREDAVEALAARADWGRDCRRDEMY